MSATNHAYSLEALMGDIYAAQMHARALGMIANYSDTLSAADLADLVSSLTDTINTVLARAHNGAGDLDLGAKVLRYGLDAPMGRA